MLTTLCDQRTWHRRRSAVRARGGSDVDQVLTAGVNQHPGGIAAALTGRGRAAARDLETRLPLQVHLPSPRELVALFLRGLGVFLVLVAPAVWLVPGAVAAPDLSIMKAGATSVFLFGGLALVLVFRGVARSEVHFDPVRREMRVMQRNARGRPETVMRRRYDNLGAARITNRAVELWDVDGSVLMRLPMRDAELRQALRVHLTGLVRVSG